MVIDRETGRTPPTAAERMDAHDRRMGIEANRPAARAAPVGAETIPDPAGPAPQRETPRAPNDRMAAAVAEMNRKQPWSRKAESPARPARIAERPQPRPGTQTGGRKTIVTSKWWDAKGPRTIELGAKGQAEFSGGFMALFFGIVIAAIVMLFIEPLLLFAGAFVLFRFGGNVLGPVGARIVDKALAERG